MFSNLNLQLRSGAALPVKASHFEKYWFPGLHFGASLELPLMEMISLKVDGGFSTFVFDHQTWRADLLGGFPDEVLEDANDLVVNGANRYILEASVTAKIFPLKKEQNINPYGIAGGGLVNMMTDDLLVGLGGPEFKTELVPYAVAGLGTEIAYWDGFRFFGQVVYKYALTKDENNLRFPLDLSEEYKSQETHILGIEFGIIFDLNQ